VNHEGTIKEFQGIYPIKDAAFNIVCAWNSVEAKYLCQAWRKLWPAVMFSEGSLNKEDSTRDLMFATKIQFMKWLQCLKNPLQKP
jgi:hypothetical protein